MKILTFILLAGTAISIATMAEAQSGEELKREIKARCESQMGEYGRSLVLFCMEEDSAAVSKIVEYQKKHPEIVNRCLSQMRKYGFSLVAFCIEEDLIAQKSIDQW